VHPSRRLVSRRLRTFIDMLLETFPHGEKPLPRKKRASVAKHPRRDGARDAPSTAMAAPIVPV
jgi:hypothetical protein